MVGSRVIEEPPSGKGFKKGRGVHAVGESPVKTYRYTGKRSGHHDKVSSSHKKGGMKGTSRGVREILAKPTVQLAQRTGKPRK